MGADEDVGALPDVRVLGGVRVFDSLLSGRQASLLVALVVAAPHPVTTDELAARIFGGDAGLRRDEVRVLVSRLRRMLRMRPGAPVVRHDASGYALVDATTDVALFDRLADLATAADGHGEVVTASSLARRALDLWPESLETPLAEHPASVRLLERRFRMLVVWFKSEVLLGHHDAVLADLLTACRANPYAEELWRIGMIALYRAERQVDALALYREIRHRLIDDLGVDPGARLREAERGVLTHQLDDVAVPPRSAGPPGPGWRGFPRYHDRYIREGSLAAALREAVAVVGHVTVTGPAGVGKTRLVVETLPMLDGQWLDGVAFCSFSSVDDPASVGAALAVALGTRVPAGEDPVVAVVGDLVDRRFLLVLDTCEHVAAAAARLSDQLRRSCPAVTVVATSRSPIRADDEVLVEVVGLDPATAGVALFVDRVGRAQPGYTITDDERAMIEVVCSQLDGLPLAIELAAARSRTFSPSELVDRLDRRFAILRTTTGGSTERHASLRGAFDWSYRALEPAEQHVFRILGTFQASTDLRAIEAVAFDTDDAAAGLAGLVDHSLVVARRGPGRTRFTQLDSLRAYAVELLDGGVEGDVARERHARHVAVRKDEYVEMAEGPDERDAVIGLDELWPDLRAAVRWAVAARRRDLAFALITGLGAHAMLREKPEVRDLAEAACAVEGDDARLADVLAAASMADWILADTASGVARATRAYELSVAAGRLSTDVWVAAMLNGGHRDRAGFAALCLRLADDARAAGNQFALAWALDGAGMAHAYQGRNAAALDVLVEARHVADRVGAPSMVALCEMARAMALLDDDPAGALVAADESLDLAGAVGSTWLFGSVPNYRAAALVRAGTIDKAADEVLTTLRRLEFGGTPQSVVNAIRNSIALLDRLEQPASCAALVCWLDAHDSGIIGTPGMRRHVDELRDRLTRLPLTAGERATAEHAASLSHQGIARRALHILEEAAATA